MRQIYILAHSRNDEQLLPFRCFTVYSTEQEMNKWAKPPYRIPITLEMVMDYLKAGLNDLYLYGESWNNTFGAYGSTDDDGFQEWFPDKGPWELGKWIDLSGTSTWRSPLIDILKMAE